MTTGITSDVVGGGSKQMVTFHSNPSLSHRNKQIPKFACACACGIIGCVYRWIDVNSQQKTLISQQMSA